MGFVGILSLSCRDPMTVVSRSDNCYAGLRWLLCRDPMIGVSKPCSLIMMPDVSGSDDCCVGIRYMIISPIIVVSELGLSAQYPYFVGFTKEIINICDMHLVRLCRDAIIVVPRADDCCVWIRWLLCRCSMTVGSKPWSLTMMSDLSGSDDRCAENRWLWVGIRQLFHQKGN